MHVPVQPQVSVVQERCQVAHEPRVHSVADIARVNTQRVGSVVRYDDGLAVVRFRKLIF